MNKGFTLVEIIAVIVILSLLVIISTPAYNTISTNIKTKNYDSKKSTIKAETLSFIEKYMKDKVYSNSGDKNKRICLTVNFLIKNGIVASDSESEEYIFNDLTNEKISGNTVYLQILYDYKNLKLIALADGETKEIDGDSINFDKNKCSNNDASITANTY